MDWSKIPPLTSLRAFAALAEHNSYSRAGAALNVTHAAISLQIKALEAWLGLKLVLRAGRGMALTAEGRELARDLAAGFAGIQTGIEKLTGSEAQNSVQITMSPATALQWMMPRIAAFQQSHPGISLMLNPTAEVVELKPGGVDLAIRYRDIRASEPPVDVLMVTDLVAVATPELNAGQATARPADLVHLPWLQELGTQEVTDWLARREVSLERPLRITHMPGSLIMAAVRRGDGVTLTLRPWVAAELGSGQLIELFAEKDFSLLCLETRPGLLSPAVKTVIKWLKLEMRSDSTEPGT